MATHPHPRDPEGLAAARDGLAGEPQAAELADVFRVLGDPVRTNLLLALDSGGELCVGDLALAVGVPETSASYGLRILRQHDLVHRRRDGRFIFYRIADGWGRELLRALRTGEGPSGAQRSGGPGDGI